MFGSFDDGKLAIDQTIPDPFDWIGVLRRYIFEHLSTFKAIAPKFVVEQIVSRENVQDQLLTVIAYCRQDPPSLFSSWLG